MSILYKMFYLANLTICCSERCGVYVAPDRITAGSEVSLFFVVTSPAAIFLIHSEESICSQALGMVSRKIQFLES